MYLTLLPRLIQMILLRTLTILLLAAGPISLQAQYCIPSSDCFFGNYIDDVTFHTLSNLNTQGNNCGFFSDGYTYFSNLSTTVTQGQSYSLTIEANNSFGHGLAAWIDFNQDGDFNDPGENVFNAGVSFTAVTQTVTIPNFSTPGTTRMRVRARENSVLGALASCQNVTFGETEDYNINIQANNQPPVADFTANTTTTCNGQVQFTDQSINFPTSWLWDFGDNTTSTQQNPNHVYATSGTYSVKLTVTNNFGTDSLTIPNYITVNVGQSPVPINCFPSTTQYLADFGITNVTFAGINNTTPDAITAQGYEDHTCLVGNLTVGQSFPISITTDQPAPHNIRVWIDYNNDGTLDAQTEEVFSANSVLTGAGTITIPSSATLNQPLRMRVSADYEFQPLPTPCGNLVNGQAEDYTVIISPNTSPPTAAFGVSATTTCDGSVSFADQSNNVPTAWFWNFGDGGTSFLQNPSHTYSNSGTYTVTLIASNLNGSDTLVESNLITVNLNSNLTPATCTPQTASYCCGYGIYNVTFASINKSSGGANVGYQDYSCSDNTTVVAGNTYTLSVTTGLNQNEDVRAWIDYNNDGAFANFGELELSSNNNSTHTATITIPTNAVLNVPLRMRVSSDFVGSSLSGCDNSQNSQVEDYAVTIVSNQPAPVADFEADTTITCNGQVSFSDLSVNSPTSWYWDFGDNNNSTQQNPTHTYSTPGVYSVWLAATNSAGSDTLSKANYIIYDPNACNSVSLPITGPGPVQTGCAGTLYDDGGDFSDYQNNTTGQITISPAGATSVSLTFSSFAYEPGDTIFIYDGPSANDPLIGAYSGFALPNGGTVSSTGPSITIRQQTDLTNVNTGFKLDWLCNLSPLPDADFEADETLSCSRVVSFTDLSSGGPTAWSWNFGDNSTSTQQNPIHIYSAPGTYSVSLTVFNAAGSDDTTIVNYITIDTLLCLPDNGNGPTQTDCTGRIYDSGGLDNYPNNTNSSVVIAPTGASSLQLDVSNFDMDQGDYLEIYDGPSTSAPLIGQYDISSPTSFSVTATSGAATLVQFSNSSVIDPGFVIDWTCSTTPTPPNAFFTSDSTESCSGVIQFSDLSTSLPTSWDWDFGDGGISSQQNPSYSYVADGIYTVTLIVSNSLGSDTLVQTDYINVSEAFCPVSTGEPLTVESELAIYPNPNDGRFTFDYRFAGELQPVIRVFSVAGQMVHEQQEFGFENIKVELDLGQLPQGLYLLVVDDASGRQTTRLVIR